MSARAKGVGPLGLGESLLFASGDLLGGGAQLMIAFYYLIFLTDVVGLRPGLAGLVVLLSKGWDAVSDPLMGVITDNTKSRWGRRKPWFLAGFFAIVCAFLLLWFPIDVPSQGAKFAYVLFAYLFYSTVQTMVMVPYAAMSSEISEDVVKRDHANGMRLFFSQISSLVCAVLPLEIVALFPSVRTGYLGMALLFGLFFAVPYLLIFLFVHERIPISAHRSRFSLRELTEPFRIRTFRVLVGLYLAAFLAMDVVSAVFAYYMKYYLHRPGELHYVLGAMLITQIAMVPVVIFAAKRLGKATTLMASALVWLLGVAFMGLIGPSWPAASIYLIAIVMGVGIIGGVVIPWIMYPDVTDVGELVFARRKSGSFSGIMTFMRKLSSALGIFVVSLVLDLSGYVEPLRETVAGKTVETLASQPDSVVLALKLVVVVFPAVLLGVILLLGRRYHLSYEVHARLRRVLAFHRGETDQPADPDEVDALTRLLV